MQREFWMWPYGKWRKVSLTSTEMPCSFPPALLFISFPLWSLLQVAVAIPCAVSWLLLRIYAMKGHFCNLKTKPNCFVGYRDPSGTEGLNWSGHAGLTFAQQREGSPFQGWWMPHGSQMGFLSFCWSKALDPFLPKPQQLSLVTNGPERKLATLWKLALNMPASSCVPGPLCSNSCPQNTVL